MQMAAPLFAGSCCLSRWTGHGGRAGGRKRLPFPAGSASGPLCARMMYETATPREPPEENTTERPAPETTPSAVMEMDGRVPVGTGYCGGPRLRRARPMRGAHPLGGSRLAEAGRGWDRAGRRPPLLFFFAPVLLSSSLSLSVPPVFLSHRPTLSTGDVTAAPRGRRDWRGAAIKIRRQVSPPQPPQKIPRLEVG